METNNELVLEIVEQMFSLSREELRQALIMSKADGLPVDGIARALDIELE